MSPGPPSLGDDLQDVEDQLHDDGTLAQLAGPSVDDWDQSAVQVTQVLREQRLAVAARQVAHLHGTHSTEGIRAMVLKTF